MIYWYHLENIEEIRRRFLLFQNILSPIGVKIPFDSQYQKMKKGAVIP
jgi:hypothetical protein